MKENKNTQHRLLTDLVSFSVLGGTFCLSGAILAIHTLEILVLEALLYASVILLSIKLGRLGVAMTVRSRGRILYTLLVNATGIVIGVVLILVIQFLIPGWSVSFIALIVSSIIAFFILGTLSPFLLSDRRLSAR